jgi:hypothetical protein
VATAERRPTNVGCVSLNNPLASMKSETSNNDLRQACDVKPRLETKLDTHHSRMDLSDGMSPQAVQFGEGHGNRADRGK